MKQNHRKGFNFSQLQESDFRLRLKRRWKNHFVDTLVRAV